MNARGWDVRQNCTAEVVIPSVGSIDSFSVVDGIIELLSVHLVLGIVDDKGVIEGDVVREVVNGWIHA
jgi:hypothetical protein